MKSFKPSIKATRILAILAVIVVFTYLHHTEYRSNLSAQKLEIAQTLSVVKTDITAGLQNNIELAKGISTYVKINPDITQEEFGLYAKELLNSESNIFVLSAAKNYIATHLYPIEGNEKVIGLDYTKVPGQLPTIEKSLKLNKIIVAGPVNLVQGGQGLIVRIPIYIGEDAWGFISVVINYDEFIEDLSILKNDEIEYAIRGRDALGSDGEVFYGNPALFDDPALVTNLPLPWGNWVLTAKPKGGWVSYQLNWQLLLLAAAIILFILYNLHLRLRNEKLEKETQQVLADSERKFRRFFEDNNAVMIIVDKDGQIVDSNNSACLYYGYAKSEFTKLSYAHLIEKNVLVPNLDSSFKLDKTFTSHHYLSNGEARDVEIFVTPIEFADKAQVSLIITDITEKRQLEQKWRLFEQVFLHAQEGMFITDENLEVVSVNPAFEDITRISGIAEIGNQPSIFYSSRHSTVFFEELKSSLKETGHWRGEIWAPTRSGEFIPLSISFSEVRDQLGEVSNYVAVFFDVSKQKEDEAKLEKLAHYDALTGLPNRVLLQTKLKQSVQQADATNTKCALMFLDLDRFKLINDSLGHDAGDELLFCVSQRLQQCLKANDTLARLGGDEFVVLIQDYADNEELLHLSGRIINKIRTPFKIAGEFEVSIGVSIGIARYPEDTTQMLELLRYADTAMYKAKNTIEKDIVFYDADISDLANQMLSISAELKQANQNDEFDIVLQPQVEIGSGKLLGAEALVRWNHPERGFLTPDKFVPIAENTGSVRYITEWMFQKVITLVKEWREQNYDLSLSINVSAMELSNRQLYDIIKEMIEDTPEIASSITIEIVESQLIENIGFTKTLLKDFQSLGFSIAIDDFGIGFSSLSYLSQLPVDMLKIDRVFVSEIDKPEQLSLIKSIIDLAHNFNLKLTAEGIETEDQAKALEALDCHVGQGYLYCKPLPLKEFVKKYQIS